MSTDIRILHRIIILYWNKFLSKPTGIRILQRILINVMLHYLCLADYCLICVCVLLLRLFVLNLVFIFQSSFVVPFGCVVIVSRTGCPTGIRA